MNNAVRGEESCKIGRGSDKEREEVVMWKTVSLSSLTGSLWVCGSAGQREMRENSCQREKEGELGSYGDLVMLGTWPWPTNIAPLTLPHTNFLSPLYANQPTLSSLSIYLCLYLYLSHHTVTKRTDILERK